MSETLLTPVNTADKGFLVCMGVLMFAKVLGQSERFGTKLALKGLLFRVDVIVTLQRKLGRESFLTFGKFADEDLRLRLNWL